jgi:hypothetical protein
VLPPEASQAIHREVIKKYKGEVEPQALGPEGREVELYNTADPAKVIEARIIELCEKEEVSPEDIVVLSSHGIEKSAVAVAGCGKYSYTEQPKPTGSYIRFSSIRALKRP